MQHFTLNNDDIKACIELASDGINMHLQDQSKLDVIHKVIYAVADAAQNTNNINAQLKPHQPYQYTICLNIKLPFLI